MEYNNQQSKKTYHITTFGCQMNVSDSERVATVAEEMGYMPVEEISQADLIVINSCSIRQKAEDRIVGMGKKIAQFKVNNPGVIAVLTGCMAKREARGLEEMKGEIQEEKYDNHLKKLMPWLDHVVQIKEIHKLPKLLGHDQQINIEEYLSIAPKTVKSFMPYIPISTGCNKFCTFCIVPFSRGRELYRPYEEIIHEVENAILSGGKEITLVGQNVNSWRGYKGVITKDELRITNKGMNPLTLPYQGEEKQEDIDSRLHGNDTDLVQTRRDPSIPQDDSDTNSKFYIINSKLTSPPEPYIESTDPHRLLKKDMPEGMIDFADLMDDIGTIIDGWMERTGNRVWIKFTSSHPYDIDIKLINVIKKHKSLAKQFHFALQSGSNSVLKRMNRHYTIEDFIAKCEMIRREIPGVGISTDVIVGFCGESEKEFQETVDAMRKLKFDQAFISEYSNRKGTVAARVYKDDVDNETKANRKVLLNEVVAEGNRERNKVMVGHVYEVLVYKKNKNGFIGRTENSKDVVINTEDQRIETVSDRDINAYQKIESLKIGDIVNVEITGATDWSLEGNITLFTETKDVKVK
jgi:tRNA-2-methylthio-N6-dimethylallyladenosine synthase